MPDVVVIVPKRFGLQAWMEEGDRPGQPWSGVEWYFYLGAAVPKISPMERVYVAYDGILRGYSPLIRVERFSHACALVRHGGAVAVTIARRVPPFRGFRYRDWEYAEEQPFPEWHIA